ncbi:MAG TPA: glycosyltransferase [Erysipelotrichaceae bacterium]|nr:glycosyltransferase [Erysipelotrichaceae bacterium]
MKVYEINVVCGKGSTGRIVTDIYDSVLEAGGRCRIAYGRYDTSSYFNALKITDNFDVYLHALMTRITDRHGLFSHQATKRLIADIKQFDPDIIHLHNIHGYYVNYRLLFEFLKEYAKPVVWTLHDCWSFTGHCAHFDLIGCEKWKTQCSKCPGIQYYPTAYVDNSSNNYRLKKKLFTDIEDLTLVTPSKWLMDLVKLSFFKEKQIKLLVNGIDLSKFNPSESDFKKRYGIENKKMLLGAANVFGAKKGFNDFIRLKDLLDENYVICLVGLTKKQLKELPAEIIGLERTDSVEKLAQIYSAADIFLNLTYEDTSSMTNTEALACGTPVLTYNTGGSPDIIDETCGRTVPRGDLPAAVEEIKRMIENPLKSEACIRRSKNFDRKLMGDKYVELYRELLEKAKDK